ncbi:helix-turn-helix transcriptional regulator [Rhodococcus artemisiae]|uniref:Helix-turn-helix transcriptional regulator n=1 Tax=Rhodococcus artemisiae TaxID=714159 RepID=A0ABU7LJC0_9NOCA|nr:helix-turn-helix transcriptional regulator [Rhodococcus artemisiae]MEE2061600.1 helix-turn-helix transcriptional regulator [Rhodococcus artemisiae]
MTTMMNPDEQLVADLGREKARETAAHIAYLRHLRQLHERGFTQMRLAKIVGVSQPTISDMLRRARIDAPDLRRGTHGGTAYEIAARYAAGEITRAAMMRELTDWEYERPAEANPFEWADDGNPATEGSFTMQVGRALRDGFLTDEDYDALLEALADH